MNLNLIHSIRDTHHNDFYEFLQSELRGLKLERLVLGNPSNRLIPSFSNNGVKSRVLYPKAEELGRA